MSWGLVGPVLKDVLLPCFKREHLGTPPTPGNSAIWTQQALRKSLCNQQPDVSSAEGPENSRPAFLRLLQGMRFPEQLCWGAVPWGLYLFLEQYM